jgi:tRNA-2-methylthio-N6-dimethylallyladenosine synthase
MNVYDSDRMADVLAPIGYVVTDSPDDADMVIINTCHIREQASEKLFSELGRLRKIKSKRSDVGNTTVIAVAGCVAQAAGKEILRRAPYVDIVLGPQTYHRLPEMLAQVVPSHRKETNKSLLDIEFPEKTKFDFLPNISAKGTSAFLSIQEGCDKFCTFCVVPYTRGAEYSRSVEDIIFEAKSLINEGVKELTLLGQNVNAYHGNGRKDGSGEDVGLGYLLRSLSEIAGVERLRYMTSHPVDMDDDLISAHGEIGSLMPFLHLPVQSGSDRILKRMNRHHEVADYHRIIDKLLTQRPELKFSSDFIVGFPGETDEDFESTLKLVREIKFLQSYSFKYSPRPGTPGVLMEEQVPEHVKSERLVALQDILVRHQREFNEESVGSVMPVLFDRRGRKTDQIVGRSPFMQPIHVNASNEFFGQIVDVRLLTATSNSLSGEIVVNDKTEQILTNLPSNTERNRL